MTGAETGAETGQGAMGRKAVALKEADPKGLVREAYAIEGITAGECRSIFLDWALSLAPGVGVQDALRCLIAEYGGRIDGHPMTPLLHDGLVSLSAAVRRGGRAARQDGRDRPLPRR